MTSAEIRKTFLDFFKSKGHEIVPSAPMVVKNDPTLMFTNSGMAPFKDIFLGNEPIKFKRVADTQKCLRVSGKHNDLEEVGVDTYHHTMFEMLGNWSFGDYFKKEAIEWSWELLTEVYKISKDRIYVTVFEGDDKEGLAFDQDSFDNWKLWIAEDRILKGNKKDNFWEMGDTGPCGPCSEIHVDLRNDDERNKTDGKTLVNESHPQVVEIWNNVFMEFNRKADGSLEKLPAQHVDTGMGFERLCMALQGKQSNYDTDVFQPLIRYISKHCKIPYGNTDLFFEPGDKMSLMPDVAMRVMADHIRAISFAIADGQLPSNNKAGYVIRRILRRAVRYQYSVLKIQEPFLHKLVAVLAEQFENVFPELKSQQEFVTKVVLEEESSFLRTLEKGIKNFKNYIDGIGFEVDDKAGPDDEMERMELEYNARKQKYISGPFAFELYDTYGFPIDLTQLMAREIGWFVDMEGFSLELEAQKTRSRAAAVVDTDDWVVLKEIDKSEFVGYDNLTYEIEISKYRKVKAKNKEQFQLVFDKTPFYAESGGQVGDTGYIETANEKIYITDTQKENNLIIHFVDALPDSFDKKFMAVVDADKRNLTNNNHSATHLMHAALRKVLGTHVAQKGSLVNSSVTRFDFSHFSKVTDDELQQIETIVNEKIRENIKLEEERNVPIEEAKKRGAMALFGEKYGDSVRVITFDKNYSVELCGGTHVQATGEIGLFKIISENSVAAGVRRVEAITSKAAEKYFNDKLKILEEVNIKLKNPRDTVKAIEDILAQNVWLQSKLEDFYLEKIRAVKHHLKDKIIKVNDLNLICEVIDLEDANAIKTLSFEMKNSIENLFLLLGSAVKEPMFDSEAKPFLSLIISDNLVKEKNLNATAIIRILAKEIQGGGGGQPFYATAGGKNLAGLKGAVEKGKGLIGS
ncbi:MAG: alanine--tRNA ligase [Bacteroidia bacterium]